MRGDGRFSQRWSQMFNIFIRLISTCLPVTIGSDTTTVTIIDDEGIYIYMYYFKALLPVCMKYTVRDKSRV